MKTVWIDRGWQPVAIGFVPNKKAWKQSMKGLNCSEPWPMTTGTVGHTRWLHNSTTGEAVIVVVLSDEHERDAFEIISTLIHEAVHVWQFLCQSIGEKEPGIEMEAYGIQHITEGLIKAFGQTSGKGINWK